MRSCSRAARPKTWSVRTFFFYMHTNAVWQSLYVRSTKNWCPLLTFTENFAQILIKCTFGNSTLWMTHRLGSPGPSPRSPSLCRSLVTTLCKFYRCSKTMCNIALCVHCERWIPVPLWRNYKIIGKSESSQP